jgi:mycofactocin precursor
MADTATETAPVEDVTHDSVLAEREPEAGSAPPPLVEAELLVEDVSIDGMCGVY